MIKCLDNGFVRLVDTMPSLFSPETGHYGNFEYAILRAARVSTGLADATGDPVKDRGLIRYLMYHRHTTPFEMVEFKFHCKMPIFVARQWIRHRTASVNEVSARYTQLPNEFYIPEVEEVRKQGTKNKQATSVAAEYETAIDFLAMLGGASHGAYEQYQHALTSGIGREQARMLLPLNIYTEWYWKIDLHNLLHFLMLRCDKHAQYEIRVFAEAMLELIKRFLPWTLEAWDDFCPMREAMLLTRLEVEKLREILRAYKNGEEVEWALNDNKATSRERVTWEEKFEKLSASTE